MNSILTNSSVPVRADLKVALDKSFKLLGKPGDWLTGEQRVAVYAETRQARHCAVCKKQKLELSPYTISGQKHQGIGQLEFPWINVIHRVTNDPGRLSEKWFKEALSNGLKEDEFIEIVSVCVQAIAIDIFIICIGLPAPKLPTVVPGKPDRKRASGAKVGPGWVRTIAPEDAGPSFKDFYSNESHFYIRRSLTLLPKETRRLWYLLNNLYLEDPRIFELEGHNRGISRAQMEFLAARASALLGCYY